MPAHHRRPAGSTSPASPHGLETVSRPDPRETPPHNRGLLGVVFAILLVLGAIWLIDSMRRWAELSDCGFTHAPRCRQLLRD